MVLFTDERVVFLMWFVGVVVVVGVVLIFIEILIRRRRGLEGEKVFEETIVVGMHSRLKDAKTLKDKLDVISDTAKKYFQDVYGVPLDVSYSKLIKGFEKARRNGEADFCKRMFAAYYSDKELNASDLSDLAGMLMMIEKNKRAEDEIVNGPSNENYIEEKRAVEGKVVVKEEPKIVDDLIVAEKAVAVDAKIRAKEEAEMREADRIREEVAAKVDLMKKGFEKNVKESVPADDEMEGIAQKIIRKERERLAGNVFV